MGSPLLSGATLLPVLLYVSNVLTQELRDRDVVCNEDSCLVLYRQNKIFLDAWRSCKHQGGNLVTIRSIEEANVVDSLLSNMELKEDQHVRLWIGLQRQPRKCSATQPMRGFSWITGEQDTQYNNWEQAYSSDSCLFPRCVSINYRAAPQDHHNNLKWKDGPCSIPVDGYLCRYSFHGMCKVIGSEGGGNTLYTTPFHLVTAFLTHIPFGSVATVPCPTKDDQTVLCTYREDGTVGWNRDPLFCSDGPRISWCHKDKGGCHHHCVEEEEHYYCDCNEGFVLAQDGMTCVQIDPCQGSPCEFECLAVMDSYRCACPEGYMLAPDEQSCLDVNECLQSPCEHICVNAPGTFECRCREGYISDVEGNCVDIDECEKSPCENDCENVMGSYICHCHLGFAPLPEDSSRCHDIDECQIEGTCDQMCINYNGSFDCYCKEGYELSANLYSCVPIGEDQQSPLATASYAWITHLPDSMWNHQGPVYPWSQEPDYETGSETESPDWLTEPPNVETVPTDLWMIIKATQEEAQNIPSTESLAEILKVEQDELHSQQFSVEPSSPSTTSTPLPDYYEDKSTTVFTTSIEGGSWMWFSADPTKDQNEEEATESPSITESQYKFHDITDNNNDFESTTVPELPSLSHMLPSTQGTEEACTDGSDSEQTQGSNWLLVGLLVPLCIFIAVMIVLAVIYCTRCAAKPQNKNATDCYHWIAGAGDKAAADMSSGGITKV